MFGCHRRRRIQECEIENHHFISISDGVLDDIVQSMCTLHRRSGEKTIEGKLRGIGLRVQRERIRESLHRVDFRWYPKPYVRCSSPQGYSVSSPNALWHVDGYHTLIRWRIVVHGGIDGFN